MNAASEVIEIPSGEILSHGLEVAFLLRTKDGKEHRFECDPGRLANLIVLLQQLGRGAEKARKGTFPPSQEEMAVPMVATDVRAGRANEDVVLRFYTKAGVPLTVSMTQNLARRTIEQIEVALKMTEPPKVN